MPLAAAAVITVHAAALVLPLRLMNTLGPSYSLGRWGSAGLGRLCYDLNCLVVFCSEDDEGRCSQIDTMKKIYILLLAVLTVTHMRWVLKGSQRFP